MDALRRTLNQFVDLYRSMSPSQRGTLIAVPTMILVALFLLMFNARSSRYVPLSWGKTFTREELMSAEQTLLDGGLTDFHSKGRRLMVPTGEAERYNAALLEGGALPTDWGLELEKQFESDGIFSSDRQQQARTDIALAKELRRIIRAVPDIEDANVIWARSQGTSRWSRTKHTVTATVNVLPRRNRQLSMQLVHSLRAAVAGMVPDLSPADVTIFDQSTGTSHTADKEGEPFDSKLLTRIKQFEQLHQNKIASHLSSYIPNVVVTVNVELENLKRSIERKQVFNPKTIDLDIRDESRNDQLNQQPQSAEPGSASNQPMALRTRVGTQKTRTTTETNTSTRSVPLDFTTSEKELIAAMPKAVQVSVAIPRDYYRKVALKRQSLADAQGDKKDGEEPKAISEADVQKIEQEVQQDVKATVLTLIPTGSPDTAINVTSYTRVEPDVQKIDIPMTETLGNAFSRWGGAIGLALFALWALRLVSKSMPKLPAPETELGATLAMQTPRKDEPQEEPTPPEVTQRDKLQGVVRDDPEMAASVLSKWIQAAK